MYAFYEPPGLARRSSAHRKKYSHGADRQAGTVFEDRLLHRLAFVVNPGCDDKRIPMPIQHVKVVVTEHCRVGDHDGLNRAMTMSRNNRSGIASKPISSKRQPKINSGPTVRTDALRRVSMKSRMTALSCWSSGKRAYRPLCRPMNNSPNSTRRATSAGSCAVPMVLTTR